MSYSGAINYLYSLQKYGIKFGLDNIRRLTGEFNNPHNLYNSVHVTGTNGKGSTSALIASILRSAGLRVGLFTSPHLVSFTERIKVDGEEITENEVIELADYIRKTVERIEDFSPTFFEVVVMMAFLYFKKKKVDIAVFEVGMGGRFDATNIISPVVSVITNIAYDHREFLGNTLKEIAKEKAGIIKSCVPVVVSQQDPEAMDVIKKRAHENNSILYAFGEDFSSLLKSETMSEICFDYYSSDPLELRDLHLPLAGEYQMQNASAAIKAATVTLERLRIAKTRDKKNGIISVIREGLSAVEWSGRLERILDNPLLILDGAHNPAAAHALSMTLKRNFLEDYKRIIVVLGIMGDKDARGIMEPLLPLASEVILTAPEYSRAAAPETLAGIARSLDFFNVRITQTVRDAIKIARSIACDPVEPALVVITGSFYTIGEAKEIVGTKGILAKLRE